MNFTFSDEQQLLADTVQRFMREHYSFESRREILNSKEGWSREIWQELANLGLAALNIPEDQGGLGNGSVETMLVMNALGSGLMLEPFFSTSVVVPALLTHLNAVSDASDMLAGIASGEQIIVLAHQEPQSRGTLSSVATRADKSADGYVLQGKKSVVAHGGIAQEFLVTARTSGKPTDAAGLRILRVPADSPGLVVRSYRTFDGQNAADLEFDRVQLPSSALIGSDVDVLASIESAHHIGISALCGEAVGIIKAVNATTLEYTKSRKQFGQPISRFQVLQHRMADMLIQAEQATSMSYLAAIRCQDPDVDERRRAISAAKVVIGQASRFVGQQAVQLHGGMGMTDELMVSHYFKRLTAIDLTFGDTDHHLQEFARLAVSV
jgi:alkylation response protein AidB-like acyl-CoA dehydrogenase